MPLIPGHAFSYDAIYTALKRAQGITKSRPRSLQKSISTGP